MYSDTIAAKLAAISQVSSWSSEYFTPFKGEKVEAFRGKGRAV